MQKKQLLKQQRRKRKDPQSRDFFCKCGNSYLSYAAVYTHVKNKHDGDKQFEQAIKKPKKEKLKRGRPKNRKQIVVSPQVIGLSICQETTLQIFDLLKDKKDKFSHHIILEGNQEPIEQSFRQEFDRLTVLYQQYMKTSYDVNFGPSAQYSQNEYISESDYVLIKQLIKGVNMHFAGQIAAKVTFAVGQIFQQKISHADPYNSDYKKCLQNQQRLDLWLGQEAKATEVLIESITKWFDTKRRRTQQSADSRTHQMSKQKSRSEQNRSINNFLQIQQNQEQGSDEELGEDNDDKDDKDDDDDAEEQQQSSTPIKKQKEGKDLNKKKIHKEEK